MKGVRNEVIVKIRYDQPKVIDMYCNCQLANLSVKAAMNVIFLKVDNF